MAGLCDGWARNGSVNGYISTNRPLLAVAWCKLDTSTHQLTATDTLKLNHESDGDGRQLITMPSAV